LEKLNYKITSGSLSVQLKHIEITDDIKSDSIIFYDESDSTDTLVQIIVDDFENIYCYLNSSDFGVNDLTVFCLEDTQTILIGGKKKSCNINLTTRSVENEFSHCLFWDFTKLKNGLILETGELDCLLRDINGIIIGQAPVDPPYEIFYEEDGIRFESIVYGTTYLKYPKEDK
jgi:hypothetical protein